MKKIITITTILLLTFTVKAQETYTCPEGWNVEKLMEYPPVLDELRPKLKVLRQWARKNNNPQAELVTNRLEYWAKDMGRYIRNYANSHTDKVCERLLVKDLEYFYDFMYLTSPIMDLRYPTPQDKFNAIDMTKYH